ncbi:MAG: calcium/sodium antiporter [Clostridia bacterium]|nr:calcium/sodium antiporter [Clostridia bacterium]
MTIFLNVLFLIIGMILLIKGADFFVGGASGIAKKLKVPSLFIGLTIVAIGTSFPELSVSITSAISNSSDLSVGNIIGSNLVNTFLILGLMALMAPVPIKATMKKIELPFLLALTSILVLFSLDMFLDNTEINMLSRVESILFLIMMILYFAILIFNARKTRVSHIQANAIEEQKQEKELHAWQIIIYIVGGLAAVVFGGECVSTTAKFLAIQMGMSEALVGLTIVAIGTSLPELVTCVVAARKGENDIAIGNIIGSSIMNISLILGVVGVISQINISTTILTDMIILLVFTIVAIVCCIRKSDISKKEGILFLIMYFAYIAFAIIRNYCF